MRLWLADFTFYLARALRAAGVGLAIVAWASVLLSEAQQSSELRAYLLAGSAALGVLVAHWLSGLPPSAAIVDLLRRPLERDIIRVARREAGPDPQQIQELAARLASLAVARVNRTGRLPGDRRAWLDALARVADAP